MFVKSLFSAAMNQVRLVLMLASMWPLIISIVQAQTVSANFGNRNGATPVVPSGIFSIGGIGTTLKDPGTINRLTEVGLDETRIWIELAEIYSKKKPYFGRLDRALQILKDTGIHPIAVIYGTPRFLGSKVCAPPTNIGQWG